MSKFEVGQIWETRAGKFANISSVYTADEAAKKLLDYRVFGYVYPNFEGARANNTSSIDAEFQCWCWEKGTAFRNPCGEDPRDLVRLVTADAAGDNTLRDLADRPTAVEGCACGMAKFGFIGHAGYCPEFVPLRVMLATHTETVAEPDYRTEGDKKGKRA